LQQVRRLAILSRFELGLAGTGCDRGHAQDNASLGKQEWEIKLISLIARAFRLATGQHFFGGVALMEDFDVKTRGANKGTGAILCKI
jgi:hypothetical protein